MRQKFLMAALAVIALGGVAEARDQIRVVGSGTMASKATAVAVYFARHSRSKAPLLAVTGTAAGIKQFCAGVGVQHPDIVLASRRIIKAEFVACSANGVNAITEIKIGYDGVVIAQSKSAPAFDVTSRELYLAAAKLVPEGNREGGKLIPNPNKVWNQVNPNFPGVKIELAGPPAGSGTRDIFIDEALEDGCKSFPELVKLDGAAYAAACRAIRDDGAWSNVEERGDDVMKAMAGNPHLVGIVAYAIFDEYSDRIVGKKVNGVAPTYRNIGSGDYPIAHPLFLYVKKATLGVVPGLKEYVAEFAHQRTIGRRGYLIREGLIPAVEAELLDAIQAGQTLPNLRM